MPIYEYFCLDCRKRVSVFFRTMSAASNTEPLCPQCAGVRLRRLVSRVAVMKSEESRLEGMADSSLMAGLENEDPRALASFMRQMSNETGEPLDAEMTEMIDRLESGESPEAIEQSMPELAGDGGMGAGIGGFDSSGFDGLDG